MYQLLVCLLPLCSVANKCSGWMGKPVLTTQAAIVVARASTITDKRAGAPSCLVRVLRQASCEAVKTFSLEHPGTSCVEIRRDQKLFVSGGWDHRQETLKHERMRVHTFLREFRTPRFLRLSLDRSPSDVGWMGAGGIEMGFLASEHKTLTAFPMCFVSMPLHRELMNGYLPWCFGCHTKPKS